jgi:hypothetical protein
MVKTNKDNLLQVAIIGEITHPTVDPSYMTKWDNEPIVGMGRGGIVYNVKVGDPCFGWAWGEKVEAGASADGVGTEREKNSFRNLSCIGNKVKIIKGEAKNQFGTVIGKVGYLPEGVHHLVLHFEQEVLDNLAIGDKVQVRAFGVGLKLVGHPGVRAISLSPELFETMKLEQINKKLIVPVTKVIPAEYVGQGSGGSPSESNNWDIQTQSPDAIELIKDLRLGDVVMLNDILSSWGRGYYEGASTIGIVSCGSSNAMGQGVGVRVLLTCKDGEIVPKIVSDCP